MREMDGAMNLGPACEYVFAHPALVLCAGGPVALSVNLYQVVP